MSVKRFNVDIWLDSNADVMAALQWRLFKVERESGTYSHPLEYICWFVVVLPAPSTLINMSCRPAALNNSRVLITKHSSIAFAAMSVWFVRVDLLHLEGRLSAAFVNTNCAGLGLSRSDSVSDMMCSSYTNAQTPSDADNCIICCCASGQWDCWSSTMLRQTSFISRESVSRMTARPVDAFSFRPKEQKFEMLDFLIEELTLIRLIWLCLGLRGVFLMSNDSSRCSLTDLVHLSEATYWCPTIKFWKFTQNSTGNIFYAVK